jgi:succinate-semialdehyde dehydrogenase/glutarate-semialdehyde dehydrogenase
MRAINPATGEASIEYPEPTWEQIASKLDVATAAQLSWRETPMEKRARILRRTAQVLRERQEADARLMAEEMGKPVSQGRAEVEKCAWVCEYYAENGAEFLVPQTVATDARSSRVHFEALGLVLAVMPWNFPFWQVFRFAAPALMAGNGAVLKHASNVPGSALAIEAIFSTAGLPEGLFTTLLVGADQVSQLIDDGRISAVTLTGSTPAGKEVAARAGRALKKTVLELGGSDPYLVLEDADLDAAVSACVDSRLINSGQSCIAAKRFIVLKTVLRAFEEKLVAQMGTRKLGDPLQDDTQLGPLARTDLRDELHDQVLRSVAAGAKLLLGGQIPDKPGAWYPASVLSQVPPGCPAYQDELFGPVAAIIPAADEDEAVRIANDSVFGLGAAVFTQDLVRGERIARDRLRAGSCFVNTFVRSDPRLPFGGIKQSGYGRELADLGIREFVNVKTVFVA